MTQIPDILKAMAEAMQYYDGASETSDRVILKIYKSSAEVALHAFVEIMLKTPGNKAVIFMMLQQWHEQSKTREG